MIDILTPVSTAQPTGNIVDIPPPSQVKIPLLQHQGRPAPVIVSEGQAVNAGQALTGSGNLFEVPVHASITGFVNSVTDHHIIITGAPPTANKKNSVTCDHIEGLTQNTNPDHEFIHWSRAHFIRAIHNAGLVGLGGACYPVAAKIDKLGSTPADILLINAAECDPAIGCDEALLNSKLEQIAAGICLAQLSTTAKKTIIGIEADKASTGKKLLASVRKNSLSPSLAQAELSIVPANYPNGAESLLMSLCSGQTLTPPDMHKGRLITFNIGTCYALYQALVESKPYTHRITTVIDRNLNTVNLRLPLGTAISDLSSACNEQPRNAVFVGGEMMGSRVNTDAVVTKAANCIQFKADSIRPVVKPCIRCGLCVDACPVNLRPQLLLAQALEPNYTNLKSLNVQHCIECACCDHVCPSNISLARTFNNAKRAAASDTEAKHQADLAKARFEKRQQRLNNSKKREFKKLDKKQSNLNQSAKAGQEAKRQLVEQALERARNKKANQSNTPASGTTDSPGNQGKNRTHKHEAGKHN